MLESVEAESFVTRRMPRSVFTTDREDIDPIVSPRHCKTLHATRLDDTLVETVVAAPVTVWAQPRPRIATRSSLLVTPARWEAR